MRHPYQEVLLVKRILAVLLLLCAVLLPACSGGEPHTVREYKSAMVPYSELSDGTWRANGRIYLYRLELRGTLPSAAATSVYTVLTNSKDFTFEKAAKSLYSSSSDDFLDPDEAVIVSLGISDDE